ncbi:MAG: Spy/CpxP family protein refolding chaperone [Pseudomonadota bacterium]
MSNSNTPNRSNPSRDRKKLVAVLASTGLLIGASFGVQAVAESKSFQHAKLYITDQWSTTAATTTEANPFVQRASWGGERHGKRFGRDWSNLTDAEIEKRVTRVVKHVSIEIEATPEQEAKITSLLTAVAKDMRPVRNEFRAAGMEVRELLMQDSVDRAALEKLRTERLARADELSKELVNALADVSEVLTSDQKKILQERMEQFRSMRRWHRG